MRTRRPRRAGEDPADLKHAIALGPREAPAVIDVATSQDAVSSDAGKVLRFVPDYQALTEWNDAQRRRRAEA